MRAARILIVVPDRDLSQSVRFALEAEFYTVSWRAGLGARLSPGEYDCTIVDHHALGPDTQAARDFVEAFRPVILLANSPHDLSPLVFRTVLKPHLGAPLIEAVRDALASQRATTT